MITLTLTLTITKTLTLTAMSERTSFSKKIISKKSRSSRVYIILGNQKMEKPLLFPYYLLLLIYLRIQSYIFKYNQRKSKSRNNQISWLRLGEVFSILVWSLHLIMSRNNKHQLRRVVANLVEASDFHHITKSNISPYLTVHLSRSCWIWTLLFNTERDDLVGFPRKIFAKILKLG